MPGPAIDRRPLYARCLGGEQMSIIARVSPLQVRSAHNVVEMSCLAAHLLFKQVHAAVHRTQHLQIPVFDLHLSFSPTKTRIRRLHSETFPPCSSFFFRAKVAKRLALDLFSERKGLPLSGPLRRISIRATLPCSSGLVWWSFRVEPKNGDAMPNTRQLHSHHHL